MISACVWCVLVTIMLGGMVYYNYAYAETKEKNQASLSGNQESQNQGRIDEESCMAYPVAVEADGVASLVIPRGIDELHCSVKNDFLNRCIYLYIENEDSSFYQSEYPFAIGKEIQRVYNYRGDTQDVFILQVNGIYDCQCTVKDAELVLSLEEMKNRYEQLIVLDVETDSEKNTERAIEILKEQLDLCNLKVLYINHNEYHGMFGDEYERILSVIRDTDADYYIQIATGQANEPETDGMSAYYQEKFYVNGFGSVQLADSLERNVVSQTSGKAVGIFEATEDMEELNMAGVVAARLYVGSYLNDEEASMLDSELFWEKAAAGIFNTMKQIYEE